MHTVPSAVPSVALDVRDLAKSFPGVQALKQVSFRAGRGQVHGLLGANGAGKSTLIKILNGVYPHGSYSGTITMGGEPVAFRSSHDALRKGIGYVPQELSVIEHLTVAENLFVGRLAEKGVVVSARQIRQRAEKLLRRWSIPLDPSRHVAGLRAGARQLLMIARALAVEPKLLVLDEPTSSLTGDETERLFRIVSSLTSAGVTVILITHRMAEVFELCEAATVLRNGMSIATYSRDEFDEEQLIEDMVGRRLDNLFPDRREAPSTDELLRVEHLSMRNPTSPEKYLLKDISFNLDRGEVLGIAGLMGAGRTELLNAIFGRLPHTGNVYLDGRRVKIDNPRDAKQAGIDLLTEDRKNEGMLFNLDVGRNISIGNLAGISSNGWLQTARESRAVQRLISQLHIKSPSPRTMVDTLSGGNQQKIMLARVLMTSPKVILLDEPTKGVDVSTKQEIYRIILSLAESGVGIIMVSSEFQELIGVCDRILVLADRRFVGQFAGEGVTEQSLVAAAVGSR